MSKIPISSLREHTRFEPILQISFASKNIPYILHTQTNGFYALDGAKKEKQSNLLNFLYLTIPFKDTIRKTKPK